MSVLRCVLNGSIGVARSRSGSTFPAASVVLRGNVTGLAKKVTCLTQKVTCLTQIVTDLNRSLLLNGQAVGPVVIQTDRFEAQTRVFNIRLLHSPQVGVGTGKDLSIK